MSPEHLIDNVVILKETPAGWLKVKEYKLSAKDEPIIKISKEEL
jgi:hypothetical protein